MNREIRYVIDTIQVDGSDFFIKGWCIDPLNENKITAEDGKGGKVIAAVSRFVRDDVNESQEVPDAEYKAGFHIRINVDLIKTRKMYLIFKNASQTEKYRIDIKKTLVQGTNWKQKVKMFSKANRADTMENIKVFGFWNTILWNYGQGLEYERWYRRHRITKAEEKEQRSHVFPYAPWVSVVIPLYNTPEKFLKEILDSLLEQTYAKVQLCLADASDKDHVEQYIRQHYANFLKEDQQKAKNAPYISYVRLSENGGISDNTNAALDLAEGEYIMLSDHDDVVEKNAIYEVVKAVNEDRNIDVLYSDEDKLDMESRVHFQPHFKTDYNIDMLRVNNYITHIFVVTRELLDRVGHFRREFDGAQDYDLILRCCEQAKRVYHIQKALYHWRCHPNSTAENPESKMYAYTAGQKALQEHLQRMGIEGTVTISPNWGRYEIDYKLIGEPRVSIIIPNKDHTEDLELCMSSIREKSTYKNYEFVIAENNSELDETFAYYKEIEAKYDNVKVVYWKEGFNYSAINNFAARAATGEYYIFLNNDVELITPNWMEELLGYCQRQDVGIVGVKLYYPDNTVQHAGVILGYGGFAGHIFINYPREDGGYMTRATSPSDLSAVTAACLMTKKSSFDAVGGFDEDFVVALNDVDYCLKVRALDQLVVFNPQVELYHYESKSRGYEDTPEKQERFQKEVKRFQNKWKEILAKGDPYYNPNLSLNRADCALKEASEES